MCIEEGMAEILTEEYSDYKYENINNNKYECYFGIYNFNYYITRCLIDIFGSEKIIYACSSQIGRAELYDTFLESGLTFEDVKKLDNYLFEIAVSFGEDKDTSIQQYKLVEYMITMYENVCAKNYDEDPVVLSDIINSVSIFMSKMNESEIKYPELYNNTINNKLEEYYFPEYAGYDFFNFVLTTDQIYMNKDLIGLDLSIIIIDPINKNYPYSKIPIKKDELIPHHKAVNESVN